jgi:hypothetical protein
MAQIKQLIQLTENSHLDICRALIESKTDVTAISRFHSACRVCIDFTHCLLRYSSGHTAMALAIESGKTDIVTYLRRIGAPQ